MRIKKIIVIMTVAMLFLLPAAAYAGPEAAGENGIPEKGIIYTISGLFKSISGTVDPEDADPEEGIEAGEPSEEDDQTDEKEKKDDAEPGDENEKKDGSPEPADSDEDKPKEDPEDMQTDTEAWSYDSEKKELTCNVEVKKGDQVSLLDKDGEEITSACVPEDSNSVTFPEIRQSPEGQFSVLVNDIPVYPAEPEKEAGTDSSREEEIKPDRQEAPETEPGKQEEDNREDITDFNEKEETAVRLVFSAMGAGAYDSDLGKTEELDKKAEGEEQGSVSAASESTAEPTKSKALSSGTSQQDKDVILGSPHGAAALMAAAVTTNAATGTSAQDKAGKVTFKDFSAKKGDVITVTDKTGGAVNTAAINKDTTTITLTDTSVTPGETYYLYVEGERVASTKAVEAAGGIPEDNASQKSPEQSTEASTGESSTEDSSNSEENTSGEDETADEEKEKEYILDLDKKIFHKRSCSLLDSVDGDEKRVVTDTAENLMQNYDPCEKCLPEYNGKDKIRNSSGDRKDESSSVSKADSTGDKEKETENNASTNKVSGNTKTSDSLILMMILSVTGLAAGILYLKKDKSF